jgi:hypothetical protein
MKSLNNQTNDVSAICFGIGILCITAFLFLSGCGKVGPAGPAGAQGVAGQTGAVGPQGTQGLPGSQGPQGVAGQTGPVGPQGEVGPQGVAGTSVSFDQLCPGFVPTYPTIFPEYAECVNGVLYGVYGENGGFWAELPPGTYSSDGINASCDLTIGADCSVSN